LTTPFTIEMCQSTIVSRHPRTWNSALSSRSASNTKNARYKCACSTSRPYPWTSTRFSVLTKYTGLWYYMSSLSVLQLSGMCVWWLESFIDRQTGSSINIRLWTRESVTFPHQDPITCSRLRDVGWLFLPKLFLNNRYPWQPPTLQSSHVWCSIILLVTCNGLRIWPSPVK